jgi:cobalt-zinc-cadmium efflux system outer membrane protein
MRLWKYSSGRAAQLLLAVLVAGDVTLAEEPLRPARPAVPVRLPRQTEELPVPTEEVRAALSLEQLEGMAIANNPTLFQAAARIDAARGKWVQVGLKPNPELLVQGQTGETGQQTFQVSQEFVTKKKLYLNRAAAEQEIIRAEQLYAAQQQRVLTDVRRRFYEALVAQRMVEVAYSLLDVGEKAVKTAESLLDAREVARIDLLQARVVANTARIRVAQAETQQQEAWRRLEAAVGVPCMSPVGLHGDPFAGLSDLEWCSSLTILLHSSPELSAAYAEVERARWQFNRESVEKYPNVTGYYAAMYDNSMDEYMSQIAVSLPLPIFNANQGNVGRAAAELAAAETDVQRIRLSLQNRLAVAFRRYDAARREFELYDKQILPDTTASLDIVRGGYPAEFDYLKLITAQREYFQAQLGRLEALNVLRGEAVLIEGMLLEDGLQLAP